MDPKYDLSKILDDDRVNLGDKNTINLVIYGGFHLFLKLQQGWVSSNLVKQRYFA